VRRRARSPAVGGAIDLHLRLHLDASPPTIEHMFAAEIRDLQWAGQRFLSRAAGLDVGEAADAEELRRVVEIADQVERAANALKSAAAARIAASGTWAGSGDRNAADWLAGTTGTTAADAAATIAAGGRMEGLAATKAAARAGRLSAAQARAVADAATADPTAEGRLLAQAAKGSIGELQDHCKRAKAAADPDPEATHRRIHRERRVRSWTDADGTAHLKASGPADAVARIRAAIDHRADQIFREARRDGRREPSDAYRFDALEQLATRAGDGPALPRGADAKIIVRVDHAALLRGRVVGDEVCEIAGIGPIAVSVVRSWMHDAFVAALLTKGTDIRSVVHLGRRFTALQRTAQEWRDPECSVLGCHRSARLERDHRHDWADTHETRFESSDRCCAVHHRLKTVEGWMFEEGTGKRRFLPPSHPDHPLQRAVAAARAAVGVTASAGHT
jgi:hypothetical protein